MPRCRKTPPQSPLVTSATSCTRSEFALTSVELNHAKPSTTINAPVRLSGRRPQA